MRPTLRQLEYIVAIAETGQVGLAAAKLNVSQPSLSAQLAEVEQDLGATLFQRGRSGSKITPVGEDVVRRARRFYTNCKICAQLPKVAGFFKGGYVWGFCHRWGPIYCPAWCSDCTKNIPVFA